jgi:hypothetical protein
MMSLDTSGASLYSTIPASGPAAALATAAHQVDDRAVGHRYADGHAVELALEVRQHLAHRAGGARGGGDQVLRRRPAAPQVLVRHVGQALVVGVGVDGGDEALGDAELVVEDLGQRRQAVGGTRGVRDDAVLGPQGVVVDADDDHGVHRLLRRHREHHLAGPRRQVAGERLAGAEDAGRLDDHVDPEPAPRDLRGIAERRHLHLAAVDVDGVGVGLDLAREDPHHGVVLQQVGEELVVEQVVDRHDLDVVALAQDTEDGAADAAEAVDADAYGPLGGDRGGHGHDAASLRDAARSRVRNRRIRSTTRWV